jgi:hypothetical protein
VSLAVFKTSYFPSSGDPARETASLGRKLALSLGAVADGLFAVLFPSTCRFCAVPLIRITRVPVQGASECDGREICPSCSQSEPAFTRLFRRLILSQLNLAEPSRWHERLGMRKRWPTTPMPIRVRPLLEVELLPARGVP